LFYVYNTRILHAESLWDNKLKAFDEKGDSLEKAIDKKGDPLEEEDGRVMRAMGLDIQSLINEQENIKVCPMCLFPWFLYIEVLIPAWLDCRILMQTCTCLGEIYSSMIILQVSVFIFGPIMNA